MEIAPMEIAPMEIAPMEIAPMASATRRHWEWRRRMSTFGAWTLPLGLCCMLGGGEVEGGVPMGGVHDIDAAGPDVGQGQGAGWERFSVLSSRSVSAARVCGEVLRDKSPQVPDEGAHADGEAGAGTSPRRQHAYHVRRSQLGCCVVRAVS